MTRFPPPRALSLVGEGDEYARWDAAYVLGSLSSADRHEFEAHLSSCPSCRESVAELSGMPALLAQLSRDDVAAIDDGESGARPPLNSLLLTSLLAKVGRGRRRSRLMTWTVTAAAAAVLALGVLVAVQSNPAVPVAVPRQAGSALAMTPVAPTSLHSTVTISSQGRGTRIQMNCTYGVLPQNSGHDETETGDTLAMVVVGRDGSRAQVATWVALSGVTATPTGSTSMPMDQIAAVQIVSEDQGDVLLQRSL